MASNMLGITLPIARGRRGYFSNTNDVLTQIKSNLKNLLLTRKGERVLQPDFGCDIHLVVFEPMTDDGLATLQVSIESAVQQWMPFVQVDAIDVTRSADLNKVQVSVVFSLITNPLLSDQISLVF